MIALLLKLGLSEKAAKIFAYFLLPILILVAFYIALNAYGDARFDAGKTQADREWQAAAKLADEKSQGAADAADVPADQRAADWAARVEQEKALLNETISDGGDPFDVLFGARGVRGEEDSPPLSP